MPRARLPGRRPRGFRIRLIQRTYDLHAYSDQEALPDPLLATVAQDLSAARAAGVRLIPCFAYRPEENSETAAHRDPPLARIRAHLAQLGPILRPAKGAIACLEADRITPGGNGIPPARKPPSWTPCPAIRKGPSRRAAG